MPVPWDERLRRNYSQKCAVVGCDRLRRNVISQWCPTHTTNNTRFGTTKGRAVTAKHLQHYRKLAEELFKENEGHEAIIAAKEVLQEIIGARYGGYSEREMQRVRLEQPDTTELLIRLTATYLLDQYDTRRFENDQGTTYALARCLLTMAPASSYTAQNGKTRYRWPPPTSLKEIGHAIRMGLGIFFQNVTKQITAKYEKSASLASRVSKPFSALPTQPQPIPDRPRAIRKDN